jgi:hypothetical protein
MYQINPGEIAMSIPAKSNMLRRSQMNNDLLTTAAAAGYLNVAKQTLAIWRVTGRGPIFAKIGRRVVYRKIDLDSFITNNTHGSTSEYGDVQ